MARSATIVLLLIALALVTGCISSSPPPKGSRTSAPADPTPEPAPTNVSTPPPHAINGATWTQNRTTGEYQAAIPLNVTDLHVDEVAVNPNGGNCAIIEQNAAWRIEGGSVRVAWDARSLLATTLTLKVLSINDTAPPTTLTGPSPLEVQVPATRVQGGSAWLVDVESSGPVAANVLQNVMASVDLLTSGLDGDTQPAIGGCAIG